MIKIELQHCIFKWEARNNKRLSIARLAKLVGVHYAVLYRYPKSTKLDLELTEKLCDELGCAFTDLVVHTPKK